ncbi:hypothetical protein EMCRGX_G027337 [Ephydatia muelleri]|eukprot:Em0518g2a
MDWLFITVAGLLLFLLGVLAVAVHAGFFSDIRVRTSLNPNCIRRVAYKPYRGPYKRANEAFGAICSLAPRNAPFGIYYDSPHKVPAEQCRYIVGCCLPSPPANSRLEDVLVARGYIIHTFPQCEAAIVTEFPFRSQFSLLIAPYRVYYALEKHIKNSKQVLPGGPFIEVYESDLIKYFCPIDNNAEFYVPEVKTHIPQTEDPNGSNEQSHNLKKNQ